jgi:hypothetical protein
MSRDQTPTVTPPVTTPPGRGGRRVRLAQGGDALKVPFETLNVPKGTFETSAMS